ncbi:hypothetical protein [Thermotalea metallivorans]|uniref:Peptidase MA-like domain-containing protein n=1 Tax=Thermotalea metallivorans TaxID=520762 RepID=A0A140L2G9_9FIRM|nr:hypothetical protein [Thermotalea metallivorans]KXG74744.1 hypothetical protein AN619_20840 [Thermotalea metallivorans]
MRKWKCSLFVVLCMTLLWPGSCSKEEEKAKREIIDLIKYQEKLVNEKKVDEYVSTLSWKSPEYVAEKKSWMRDIKNNDIQGYTLAVEKIEIVDQQVAYVDIIQNYHFQNKNYQMRYPLVVMKERGSWKDGDLKFNSIYTEHFEIKYFDSSKKYAKKIRTVCEEAYENVKERYGEAVEGITVIKLYKDKEMLRQSVKLSFGWQFAGWYEYPESIKTTEFEDAQQYREILEHELIHKLTIKKSNNNLPYWFAEGLAMYFSNFENQPEIYSTKTYYVNSYRDHWMNIEQLEKLNLEAMEREEEISNYYDGSGMIVKFMIETYGLNAVKKIVEVLGQYDYQEGTGAEVDRISVKRFHQVVPKVLGISVDELDGAWEKYLKEPLDNGR